MPKRETLSVAEHQHCADLIQQYQDRFFKLQFNQDATFKLIDFLYTKSGYQIPHKFIARSPFEAQFMINYLQQLKQMKIGDQIRNQIGNQIGDQIGDQIGNQIGNQIRNQIWDQIGNQIGNQIRNQIWNQIWGQIGDQIGNQIGDQIRNQIRGQMQSTKCEYYLFAYRGDCWDLWWCCQGEFWRDLGIVKHELFDQYLSLFKNAGMFMSLQFEHCCIAIQPPIKILRDARNRLHCETGPAVEFADGYKQYWIHEVSFNDKTAKNTFYQKWFPVEQVQAPASEILQITNTEQRAAVIDAYNWGYLFADKSLNMQIIDSVEECANDQKWYSKQLIEWDFQNRKRRGVMMHDYSHPEKIYVERVPIEIKTVVDAMAWRFNMSREEYLQGTLIAQA